VHFRQLRESGRAGSVDPSVCVCQPFFSEYQARMVHYEKALREGGLLKSENLEARVGIEPTHKGFADLSLTTWVPRLDTSKLSCSARKIQCSPYVGRSFRGAPG